MYDEDYDYHEPDRHCNQCEEYESELEIIELHFRNLFALMKLKGLLDDDHLFNELEEMATALNLKIEV